MSKPADIALPAPRLGEGMPVADAIARRRSLRAYRSQALSVAELAQILWAALGVTAPDGKRAVPSAGALNPLEAHVVVGAVDGLPPGLYRYDAPRHRLAPCREGDLRRDLAAIAAHQDWMAAAPAILALTARAAVTTARYGRRGDRYVVVEIGHAAQNACLQATALGLGAGCVGAFGDAELAALLGLPEGERPLYLVALGRPA